MRNCVYVFTTQPRGLRAAGGGLCAEALAKVYGGNVYEAKAEWFDTRVTREVGRDAA